MWAEGATYPIITWGWGGSKNLLVCKGFFTDTSCSSVIPRPRENAIKDSRRSGWTMNLPRYALGKCFVRGNSCNDRWHVPHTLSDSKDHRQYDWHASKNDPWNFSSCFTRECDGLATSPTPPCHHISPHLNNTIIRDSCYPEHRCAWV